MLSTIANLQDAKWNAKIWGEDKPLGVDTAYDGFKIGCP